jgi:hypothetical protein
MGAKSGQLLLCKTSKRLCPLPVGRFGADFSTSTRTEHKLAGRQREQMDISLKP